MKKYLLEIEDDIANSFFEFLKIIPENKIKLSIIQINEEKEKSATKTDPWEMLRNANIDAPEDSSVEHDHYIHGTPKLYSDK